MHGTDAETQVEANTPALLKGDVTAQDNKNATQAFAAPAKRQEAAETRAAETHPTETHVAENRAADPRPAEAVNGIPPQSEVMIPEDSATREVAPLSSEVELKLLVAPDRLADFNEAAVIVANARNKGARKHLKAVYYDTAERTLRRNGLSLRVRQSGARFIQTAKAEFGNDPLRRGEWDANVPSIAPDVALATPFMPVKLREDLERQPLDPVFTADIHRHQRVVGLPSGTVVVAFDRGLLKAGDRSVPVSEIELELKDGNPSAIFEIALRLADHGPVRPSIRSKAERGFDLAADTPPAARKPKWLRLAPSVSLDDALSTILRSCFHHLLASLPAAEDGRNPEGVHQVRVALRRLRSALDLMRSIGMSSAFEQLLSDTKWLAKDLSAARDWDIFQGATLPTVAQSCSSIADFDSLGRITEERRSAAYHKARLALVDRRSAYFVLRLGAWIETRGWRSDVGPESLGQLAGPATDFARGVLSAHHAKVLKRGRRFKSLTPEKRHRMRLALKKLRYTSEFLLPLYADRKSTKRFSDRLAELQEELGSYQDMAATAPLLASLAEESSDCAVAAATVAGWQAHAMVGIESRLRNAWRGFAKTNPPWSIATEP